MLPRRSAPAQSPLVRAAGRFAVPSTLVALDAQDEVTQRPEAGEVASRPHVLIAPQRARSGRIDARHPSERDADRGIAISTNVMAIVGDAAAGVLLSQVLYWTRRGVATLDRDGWIYKTAVEWQEETGMTWKVQRRARHILERLGLLEERRRTMPARLEFRLNLTALGRLLAQRSEIEVDRLDLVTLTGLDPATAEQLFGRGFLFRSAIARVFPLPTAMMCSRLLIGVRLPAATTDATSASITRHIAMPRERWHLETGLTRDQWQTARRNLAEAGVLVERRRNFPRRVDLAIDLAKLAALLAARRSSSFGSVEAGLDRAKQPTGRGHSPIPPAVSPNPTFRDRPIQPLSVAQSHLYIQGDELLHPQHPRMTEPARAFEAFGWGSGWVGSGYSGQELAIKAAWPAVAPDQAPSCAAAIAAEGSAAVRNAPSPTPAVAQGTLHWPRLFTEGDREHAARHLAGLDRAKQQMVLDEIDWMSRGAKSVRSPVALARTLARQVASDRFLPEGAHRVAAERETAEAEAARRRQEHEKARLAAETPLAKPVLSSETEATRERLKAMVERMRMGRTA